MSRSCDSCQVCCELLPVKGIGKLANTSCQHQCSAGCAVYHQPSKGFPKECGSWSCLWLLKPFETRGLDRPDKSHYVIDAMPDVIKIAYDGGKSKELVAFQVWCDPAHRDAHRDPMLRAFLSYQNRPAIIRFSDVEAVILFPPGLSEDGQWHETGGVRDSGRESVENIGRVQELLEQESGN